MTELRDARLRKALDAAPDAQLRPQPLTREAIRAAAHGAAQPAWKRWWPRGGGAGPRWAAAFATFLVATLVVVLWEGREVPGARPETDIVAHAPAPAPAPLPPSAPPPAPQMPAQAAAPPPAAAGAQAPAPAARPQPAPRPEREARARRAVAPPPPVLADEAPAAAEALAREADAAHKQQRAEMVAPESPVATAGAPAATTAQRQVAPAAPPAALRAAPTALAWSQVRIESAGRAVVVPRAQAGRLPALVTSLLAAPSEDAEAAGAGSLRLELGQGDEAAGVLERVGERWRWTPVREGHTARWLRPEAELAAALDEEVERLLRR